MQKPLTISIAVCLCFTGCSVFKKSKTWETVTKNRVDTTDELDPSKAYAKELHRSLAKENVEHKVVTYQYRYKTRLREEAVGVATAVVYKDETNPKNPWWIMDERLAKPVWLPNDALEKQVSFYLRRDAEIVEQHDFPTADASHMIADDPSPAIAQPKAAVAQHSKPKHRAPVADQEPAVVGTKPQPTNPSMETAHETTGPITSIIAPDAVVPVPAQENVPWIRPARFGPSRFATPAITHSITGSREQDIAELFRKMHGTSYDSASALDRSKMLLLSREARLK
jgi:hypothetical protein